MDIKRNSLYSFGGAALPLVVAVLTIPVILDRIGQERFSALLLIWALIGYFNLFDFGVSRSLTHEVSQRAHKSKTIISSFLKAGIVIVILNSFIGMFLIYFILIPYVNNFLDISQEITDDLVKAFIVAAITVFPSTLTSGLRGGLEGLNRFKQANINRIILGVSLFLSPILAIEYYGNSLEYITILILIIRIFVLILTIWQLKDYVFLKTKISICKIIPRITKYGIWVLISGILGSAVFFGDRFILASFEPLENLNYYALPQEGLVKLLVIPGGIAAALFHNFSVEYGFKNDLNKKYYEYRKKVFITMLTILIIVVIFSKYFYSIWINEDFAQNAYILTMILSIGILFNSIGLISLTLLSSVGRVKTIGLIHFYEFMIFLGLYIVSAKYYGAYGVAIAWSTRSAIDYYYLNKYAVRYLNNG